MKITLIIFPLLFSVFICSYSQEEDSKLITIEINDDQFNTMNLIPLPLSSSEIDEYYQYILNLQISGSLIPVEYPEMSDCGGKLTGYFKENEIVLLTVDISVEFSVETYICVIDENKPLKIVQQQKVFEDEKFDNTIFEEIIVLNLTDPMELYNNKTLLSGESFNEEIENLNKCYNIRLNEIKTYIATNRTN